MANTETNNNAADGNPHDMYFPVAHNKAKFKYMNVGELVSNDTRNIRHAAGMEAYGVKIGKDTYDLADMEAKIEAMGGIQMPILASLQADGTLVVLQGNRRTRAGQRKLADPNCPVDLRKALMERTPVRILEKLTPEQEMELIQDQEQKDFLRSEALRHLWEQVKAGKSYGAIVAHNERMCRKFVSNKKKEAEVMEEVANMTGRERAARIQTWLRGSIDEYVIAAYKLGKYVQTQTFLSELRLDGLLTKEMPQPVFLTTNNSQKRMAALEAAAKKDGSKHNPFLPADGTEFKALCDKFHQEDFGTPAAKAKKESGPKMLTKDEVKGLEGTFQSRLAKSVVNRVLGNEVKELTSQDDWTAIIESKLQIAEAFLPKLNLPTAALIRLVFVNPDPVEFAKYLENQLEETVDLPPSNPDQDVRNTETEETGEAGA